MSLNVFLFLTTLIRNLSLQLNSKVTLYVHILNNCFVCYKNRASLCFVNLSHYTWGIAVPLNYFTLINMHTKMCQLEKIGGWPTKLRATAHYCLITGFLNESKVGLFLSCGMLALEGPHFEQRKLIMHEKDEKKRK